MTSLDVPSTRIHTCSSEKVNGGGSYVLYWMIANRRPQWNFALQRALYWATELRKPLLIIEALNCDYRWASTRLHDAILQGMRDNLDAFKSSSVTYHPFVERFPSQGKGMVAALAQSACLVVTDDYPAFDIPRWIDAAAAQSPALLEKVDSNGIFPMRATDRVFTTAHSFRRFLQKNLRDHLSESPLPDPLKGIELPKLKRPSSLMEKWPAATARELSFPHRLAESIAVDHSVMPCKGAYCGPAAGEQRLKAFVKNGLKGYAENHNHPELDSSSHLSSHLHFGHLSAHQVFKAVTSAAGWSEGKLGEQATGSRENWWGAGRNSEAFLEQLVTWRELGFNACAHLDGYDRYTSLPDWARKTLARHAPDRRPFLYTLRQFENAETHDPLWNAAQTQLLREGRIHNYLRMLWGKKILEWSASPEEALETLIHLNNKYALDGRDPNSYSGIFWILGRYDRPWGPERPIFGTVRYMSSENTARKTRVKSYIQKYSPERDS